MKVVINTLKREIEWANRYLNQTNITNRDIRIKNEQIAKFEKAIKLLEASERNKSTETSDKHETKQLNILGVSNSAFPIFNETRFKLKWKDRIKALFGSKIYVSTTIYVHNEVGIYNKKTKVNIRVGEDKTDLKSTNVL